MHLDTIPSQEIMPGCHGKMVHGTQLTWAFWDIKLGAEVPMHHHPHEQIMHVVSGEFEFTLDGQTQIYGPGSVVHIASNRPHSGRALTPCRLMDVFSPVREEYR
jgi:quercetin dioxygenase-like cupin family protein